jgi:hypothetical protein
MSRAEPLPAVIAAYIAAVDADGTRLDQLPDDVPPFDFIGGLAHVLNLGDGRDDGRRVRRGGLLAPLPPGMPDLSGAVTRA